MTKRKQIALHLWKNKPRVINVTSQSFSQHMIRSLWKELGGPRLEDTICYYLGSELYD